MPGVLSTDDTAPMSLVTSHNPSSAGASKSANGGTMGDVALRDGLIIIGFCWLIVFGLTFSLRGHNI